MMPTRRELMERIIQAGKASLSADVREALYAFAEKELAILDKTRETRKNSLTKAQKENLKLKEEIMAKMTEVTEPLTTAEMQKHYFPAFSVQKISALVSQLVEDKQLQKAEVKIDKQKRNVYSVAATE